MCIIEILLNFHNCSIAKLLIHNSSVFILYIVILLLYEITKEIIDKLFHEIKKMFYCIVLTYDEKQNTFTKFMSRYRFNKIHIESITKSLLNLTNQVGR